MIPDVVVAVLAHLRSDPSLADATFGTLVPDVDAAHAWPGQLVTVTQVGGRVLETWEGGPPWAAAVDLSVRCWGLDDGAAATLAGRVVDRIATTPEVARPRFGVPSRVPDPTAPDEYVHTYVTAVTVTAHG